MSFIRESITVVSRKNQLLEVDPWNNRVKMFNRLIVESGPVASNAAIFAERIKKFGKVIESMNCEAASRRRKAKRRKAKPRSPVEPVIPIPLMEREIGSVKEAAAVGPWTEGALRHRIWLTEAYAATGYEGKPELAEFAKCIHRPRGQRRVYLNIPRLIALVKQDGGDHA